MQRTVAGCLATLMLAGVALADESIVWSKDWAEAEKQAASSGKPIMIDFFTDWCGWCKRLDKDTYTHADVVKISREFVNLKTDAEREGKDLAKKYGVSGFPTIVFLNKSGEQIGRIVGYLPPGPFSKRMTQIHASEALLPQLEAKLKENPGDGEANAQLAEILATRQKRDEAEAAVAAAEKAGYSGEPLARAYNELGDSYANEQKNDKAVELFRKADAMSKDTDTRAYAKVSIVVCASALGQKDAAKAAAQELIDLPGAPEDMVIYAKRVLGAE